MGIQMYLSTDSGIVESIPPQEPCAEDALEEESMNLGPCSCWRQGESRGLSGCDLCPVRPLFFVASVWKMAGTVGTTLARFPRLTVHCGGIWVAKIYSQRLARSLFPFLKFVTGRSESEWSLLFIHVDTVCVAGGRHIQAMADRVWKHRVLRWRSVKVTVNLGEWRCGRNAARREPSTRREPSVMVPTVVPSVAHVMRRVLYEGLVMSERSGACLARRRVSLPVRLSV